MGCCACWSWGQISQHASTLACLWTSLWVFHIDVWNRASIHNCQELEGITVLNCLFSWMLSCSVSNFPAYYSLKKFISRAGQCSLEKVHDREVMHVACTLPQPFFFSQRNNFTLTFSGDSTIYKNIVCDRKWQICFTSSYSIPFLAFVVF